MRHSFTILLLLALGGLLTRTARAEVPLVPQWVSYAGQADGVNDSVLTAAPSDGTNLVFAGRSYYGYLSYDETTGINHWDSGGDVGNNGFLALASPSGTLLWLMSLGSSPAAIQSVAITSNAVYAVGYTADTPDFSAYSCDAFLTKLDKNTGDYAWVVDDAPNSTDGERKLLEKVPETPVQTNAVSAYAAVAVDPADGSVYAAGYSSLTNFLNCGTNYTPHGKRDAVIVKYTANGDLRWIHCLGGTADDAFTALATDSNGVLYAAGTTASTTFFFGSNSLKRASATVGAFLVRLNADGEALGCTLFGTNTVAIRTLALHPQSPALFVGGDGPRHGFVGSYDRSTFATNWTRAISGISNDSVRALACLPNGRLVIGGATTSPGLIPSEANLSSFRGTTNAFVLELAPGDGSPLVGAYAGGDRADALNALAVLGTNQLVLAGETTSHPDADNGWLFGGFWDTWEKTSDTGMTYGFVGVWAPETGTPPAVTNDLADVTCYEGETATFALGVSGGSIRYRWFANGTLIPDATNTAYSLAAAAPSNSGWAFSCVASNYFGGATSRVARLTVIANGTLAVSFTNSPAAAAWSIDAGTNWQSGDTALALRPGTYTVTFAAVAGWAAPADRTATLSTGAATRLTATYSPSKASASRTVAVTNVTLSVTADNGSDSWTLVEAIPGGLTPAAYSNAVWSESARTLTFTGTARTATLAYSVANATSGCWNVSGTITAHPSEAASAVTGDTRILQAKLIRIIAGTDITIRVASTFSGFIYETLPSGLSQTNASPTPYSMGNQLLWMSTNNGKITYSVSGTPGTYTISGSSSTGEPIFGDDTVTIATPPVPDILSFTYGGAGLTLSFTSGVDQVYWVQTNADLRQPAGWADCLSVTGTSALTTAALPTNGPALFYRIHQK